MSFRARLQTSLSSVRDRFGCLYWASTLWSILLGVLFYVIGRLPLWYFYQTGPSSDERGPFWDTGVWVIMTITGLLGLLFFGLYRRRWMQKQVALRRTFTIASIAIPLTTLFVIVILWHYNTTQLIHDVRFFRDLWMPALLWIALGTWLSIFLVPFGFLSGIVFGLIFGSQKPQ